DSDYEDCHTDDPKDLVSPWTNTFEELRSLMIPVGKHMHKRVTREGHQERERVPTGARVIIRYSGYWEGESAPFDSSMLRGNQYEFETGTNQVLEGLEAAVLTMRPYEVAEFIISYKLLFRELGCPPRIKPKADGLFKIEVIDFTLIGDEGACDKIAEEDRDKFCVVHPKVLDIHLYGKDCVKRGHHRNAVRAFEKAVNALNYCRLANDEEESKQKQLLITLYQNLMICYNKLAKPQRTCIMMKALRRLTDDNPSSKALFQEGRALGFLGEYERARQCLVKAYVKEPGNKQINNEIVEMDARIAKYKEASRELWSRALETKIPKSEPKTKSEKDVHEEKFIKDMEEIMEKFQDSTNLEVGLSRKMYDDSEFDLMCDLARRRNLTLSASPVHPDLLTLSKKIA
ncbi:hypothetical protein KR018_000087, partial [Drosophila ironensis]